MLRPRGPPRPNYSRGNMAKSCKTWRSKSSDRKATAKVTSSLLARPPICQPAELKGVLVASYQVLLGQAPMSNSFSLSPKISLMEEQPTPAAPPTPMPKQSCRPKRQHASSNLVDSKPLSRTMPQTALEGPPSPKARGPTLE